MEERKNYRNFRDAYNEYIKNNELIYSQFRCSLQMYRNQHLNTKQTKFVLAAPTAYMYVEKQSERWEYDYDESWRVYKLKDPQGNIFEWAGIIFNSFEEAKESVDKYLSMALDCIDEAIKRHQKNIDILEELEGKLHEISNANKREN